MKMKYHDYLLALPDVFEPFSIFIINHDDSLCVRDTPVSWYVCLFSFYKSYGYKFYFQFIKLSPANGPTLKISGLISGYGIIFTTF